MNVRWSNRAATEFAATAAYVASEFGQRAAQKMRNTIDKAVDNISHFPKIGVASFTDEETGIGFRELQCRLNSVVYAIHNDEVCIVSIWCNLQSLDYLYASLQEDAKNMLF